MLFCSNQTAAFDQTYNPRRLFVGVGQALNELSKDKPSGKNAESLTSQFVKSLESIENDLSSQINYLTTVSTGQYTYLFLNVMISFLHQGIFWK